jgi:peptidoglycan/xylan/chitin deacetylase (PgdA/CDA1 family)
LNYAREIEMRQGLALISAFVALFVSASMAAAESCADNPDLLGTSRTLVLDTSKGLEVGHRFGHELPLAKKEVVLTFDDGPLPVYSEKVRAALKAECVKATFFLVGRNAATYPDFARKLAADGHTVASHTWSHDMRMPEQTLAAGLSQINRGIAAVNVALKTSHDQPEVAPFFRFPGLNSTQPLRDIMKDRGVGVFDIDIEGGDWIRNRKPADVLRRVMTQLREKQRGIVLLHDIQPRTVAMLPAFLKTLKKEGYKVVHIVPKPKDEDATIASLAPHDVTDAVAAEKIELPVPGQPFQTATAPSEVLSADDLIVNKPTPQKKHAAPKAESTSVKLQAMATVAPAQLAPDAPIYVPRRAHLVSASSRHGEQPPIAIRYAEARPMSPSPQITYQRRERPKYLLNQLFGVGTN